MTQYYIFQTRLHPDKDRDVIAWLQAQPNRTEAIRNLVRGVLAGASS